mmetsp:Transcript_5558/g.7680  ORF Transcript_5558/g.7680 Transcript_5558/m.7680 type:complete len:203 (+) Transcript_5558:53-661(+)
MLGPIQNTLAILLVIGSSVICVQCFIFHPSFHPNIIPNTLTTLGHERQNYGLLDSRRLLSKGFGKQEHGNSNNKKKESKEAKQKREDLFSKLNPKIVNSPTGEATSKFSNPRVGDFQVFDSLVKYPTDFQIKVIGDGRDGFVEDMVKIGADATNMRPEMVSHSTREQGKWTSVTLNLYVTKADQLYKCYEEIDKDPRVKFKF